MKFVGYVKANSVIHKLDPRVKILVSLVLSLIALTFNDPVVVIALFVSVVMLSAVAHVEKYFLSRSLPMAPVAATAFVLWIIFFRSQYPQLGQETLFQYGFITIDRLSVMYGIAMAFRVLTVLGIPLLFFATTTFSALSLALVRMKVRYLIAFTLALSLRFLDYGLEEMAVIREAQVSRGLKLKTRTMIERPQNIISLLKPLMERLMRFQEYLAISMDLRAFGAMPTRTFFVELKMRIWDYLTLIAALALLAVSILLRLRGWGSIV